MIGFDCGLETDRILDGRNVTSISPSLIEGDDTSTAANLATNIDLSFIGVSMHGSFDFSEDDAVRLLNQSGNPHGRPNSDVIRPILNAFEITKRSAPRWAVAFSPDHDWPTASSYEAPADIVRRVVKPIREVNHRKAYRDRWWIHGEARPAMQKKLAGLPRFPATPRVSKHRIVVWVGPEVLPSDATVAFARPDDFFFGVLQSKHHSIWALKQGTRLETRPRYTPTTCFETFPLPLAAPCQEAAIASAAKELNDIRERWLNPPEWTKTAILDFPGSVGGPWSHFIDPRTVDARTGIGIVRYPRLEPRDARAAAKLKQRTLTVLYNQRPAWLDHAHRQLDVAVADAYGWPVDLTDQQIVGKLLELNIARTTEEARPGAAPTLRMTQRGKREDELI